MKSILTSFVFLWIIASKNLSYSQFISYEYTQILSYSLEITYSYSTGSYQPYSPDMNFYGNALAQMQARYDRNHAILSKEYYKLKDLNLINVNNKTTLNNYRANRLNWIYNAISTWDLGNESNTSNIRNYCCEIYSYTGVKNELNLLQSCQIELNRIKYKDPDNFLYSKRYNSIMKTLEKLKNCSVEEIKNLSWERTELETQNAVNETNQSVQNNNQTYFKVPNSSYFYQKNTESIQIDNITKTTEFTILTFTSSPSKKYSYGWTVCFGKTGYIEQNGVKYFLKKATGIPLCPEKHTFSNINEHLTFKLYFDKTVNLDKPFNLYENISGGFEFYNVSK